MDVKVNGRAHQVAPATSIAKMLAELGLEPRHVAVEVNLELVPRTMHSSRILQPGDCLEVVTLVGGG